MSKQTTITSSKSTHNVNLSHLFLSLMRINQEFFTKIGDLPHVQNYESFQEDSIVLEYNKLPVKYFTPEILKQVQIMESQFSFVSNALDTLCDDVSELIDLIEEHKV